MAEGERKSYVTILMVGVAFASISTAFGVFAFIQSQFVSRSEFNASETRYAEEHAIILKMNQQLNDTTDLAKRAADTLERSNGQLSRLQDQAHQNEKDIIELKARQKGN